MNQNIAVIDETGGGIGTKIITQLWKKFTDEINIFALGTNAAAIDRMMQAKVNKGAS